jgi:hypothetical protein
MGAIRFLLALAVTIAHVGKIPFYSGIGSLIAVQGFYVISGFLIARVWDIKYARQAHCGNCDTGARMTKASPPRGETETAGRARGEALRSIALPSKRGPGALGYGNRAGAVGRVDAQEEGVTRKDAPTLAAMTPKNQNPGQIARDQFVSISCLRTFLGKCFTTGKSECCG